MTGKPHNRLENAERNRAIVAMLESGATYKEAAYRFNLDPSRVGQIWRSNGHVRNPRNCSSVIDKTASAIAERKAEVIRCLDAGMTQALIARRVGITKQAVSLIAVANGRRLREKRGTDEAARDS